MEEKYKVPVWNIGLGVEEKLASTTKIIDKHNEAINGISKFLEDQLVINKIYLKQIEKLKTENNYLFYLAISILCLLSFVTIWHH